MPADLVKAHAASTCLVPTHGSVVTHTRPRLPTKYMAMHALTQRGAADDLDEALLALALARHEPHGAGVRQHVAAQRPLRVGHKHRAAAGVAHHLRGGHEEGREGEARD